MHVDVRAALERNCLSLFMTVHEGDLHWSNRVIRFIN